MRISATGGEHEIQFGNTNHSIYWFEISADDPVFVYSGGIVTSTKDTPYHCYLECLKMNMIKPGRPLTIGLTGGEICLCGYEHGNVSI